MDKVFSRSPGLTGRAFHYCPGCTHGIVHRLIAETMCEMDILGKTIGVSPVGCTYNNYDYFSCDMIQAAHGRAPAVATGIKRVHPGHFVFTYQGDGDLAAIGTAEIVHAALRGEKISVFFVNNAVYGMTSGQMAPTTLLGQVTTTSPFGRSADLQGFPFNVSEMIATLPGAVYVQRVAVNNYKHIIQTKKAIRKAFEVQKANLGFAMVEILSTCPTNWGKDPLEAAAWLEEAMIAQYPLGVFRGQDLEVP
jgi:2-oxoglutarate ferredoxin oxidoreductase subunit beta